MLGRLSEQMSTCVSASLSVCLSVKCVRLKHRAERQGTDRVNEELLPVPISEILESE